MLPCAMALALLVGAAPDEPTELLVVQERVPFAFLLNTPTGGVAKTSSSEIIRFVTDTLRRDTSFAAQIVDGEVVKTCQGELTCLVLAARRDYERDALLRPDGAPLPYREHVRRMSEDGQRYARYLLVLSNVSVPDRPDRMTASLVDTDLALEIYHEADRNRAEWEEWVETRISTAAMPKGTLREDIGSDSEAAQFVERLVRTDYQPLFEGSGHWQPYGALDLVTDVEGLEVVLDGQSIGSTRGERTRLTRLLPGTRAISVRHPDYATLDNTVTIRRGETALLTLDPIRVVTADSQAVKSAIFYTGLVSAAIGVGIVTVAALRQDGDVRTVCFEGPCPSGRFQTLGYDSGATIAQADEVNPSGLLLAPLGVGLVTLGAAFALGPMIFDDASPWWSVLVGAVSGVAVYGLGAALH